MFTPVAILTVKDVASMTPKGRKQIADWLRKQATGIIRDGKDYAPHFRARYNVLKGR